VGGDTVSKSIAATRVRAPPGLSTEGASVLAVVAPVLASIASTPHAACHDRGCTGHSGGPRNRPSA
jgi:hypothetical protein